MGGCLCGRKRDGRILLLGLDGVGKTRLLLVEDASRIDHVTTRPVTVPRSVLTKLKAGVNEEVEAPQQTVGFNIENITYKKKEYCVWDVSGKDKSRPLWSRYYSDTIALVWVVDSSDERRLQLCRQELHQLLREPELGQAIILVFLNKQDLRNALSPVELIDKLSLRDILKKRTSFMQPCSAKRGEGLTEGFAWLTVNL